MIYIFGAAFDPPHAGHNAIIRALLHYKNPERIILIPSGKRNDKAYKVSDAHRKAMIDIFVSEINHGEKNDTIEQIEKVDQNSSSVSVTLTQEESAYLEGQKNPEQIPHSSEGQVKVVVDYYFLDTFTEEMITRDVDLYAREKYGEDVVHVFGTDTIASMPEWDEDQYAARVVRKLFVPRFSHREGAEQNVEIQEFQKHSTATESLTDAEGLLTVTTKQRGIGNFEFFTDSHFPDISSTEIRRIIPEYTGIEQLYEKNPKFAIPGLSRGISRYILEKRLYRQPPFEGGKSEAKRGSVSEKNPQSRKLDSSLQRERILLHVCCGPDVTMPILQLQDEYDILCFWYDPNIEPRSEYDKRFEAFKKVCEIEEIPYIKGAYDVGNFHKRIKGLEHTPEKGEKCTNCYDMRLRVSAKLAKKLGIQVFTTSLNTSPKKDLEKIFTIGSQYAREFGLEFLSIPFRKNGGFDASVEYTKKHNIYRQNYCGCSYSLYDSRVGKQVG